MDRVVERWAAVQSASSLDGKSMMATNRLLPADGLGQYGMRIAATPGRCSAR